MAAPSSTFNAAGDIRSAASLAASANSTYALDFSTKIEGQVTIKATFGTVSTTYGLQIDLFNGYGSTVAYTTIAEQSYTLQPGGSTTGSITLKVGTGKYQLKITNLDTTNGLTNVEVTSATVDSFA